MTLDDVPDDVISDIAFEINQIASHYSWTDEERAEQYRDVADFLHDQK